MLAGSAAFVLKSPRMDAVLFDLGKVLLDWSPRYYYERFFPGDEAALARFLDEVVAPTWILEMDRGLPMAEAIAARQRLFPQHAELIARWREGWPEMLRGEIGGTVEILEELASRGRRLCALTNFSHETWPVARQRFDFLQRFEHVVVSGEVGLVKPDPLIYRLAIERCRLAPARTVFVDDVPANVDAARAEGLHAVHFTTPERLREELVKLGAL
jgi:2-haloacid dehalogenase